MGDFNLNLQIIKKYLEPMGFKGALRNVITNQSLGNQIDQVFSN